MKEIRRTHQKIALSALLCGLGTTVAVWQPLLAQPARSNRSTGNSTRPQPPARPGGSGSDDRQGPPPPPCGPRLEDLADQLKLTADQQKQIKAALDKERAAVRAAHEQTRKTVDGILTADQLKQLKQLHDSSCPPPPDGGPGGGGPGGPPGFDGPPPPDGGPGNQ